MYWNPSKLIVIQLFGEDSKLCNLLEPLVTSAFLEPNIFLSTEPTIYTNKESLVCFLITDYSNAKGTRGSVLMMCDNGG